LDIRTLSSRPGSSGALHQSMSTAQKAFKK
jgi:hypothetical protein